MLSWKTTYSSAQYSVIALFSTLQTTDDRRGMCQYHWINSAPDIPMPNISVNCYPRRKQTTLTYGCSTIISWLSENRSSSPKWRVAGRSIIIPVASSAHAHRILNDFTRQTRTKTLRRRTWPLLACAEFLRRRSESNACKHSADTIWQDAGV